jgi:hypothetical protein
VKVKYVMIFALSISFAHLLRAICAQFSNEGGLNPATPINALKQ